MTSFRFVNYQNLHSMMQSDADISHNYFIYVIASWRDSDLENRSMLLQQYHNRAEQTQMWLQQLFLPKRSGPYCRIQSDCSTLPQKCPPTDSSLHGIKYRTSYFWTFQERNTGRWSQKVMYGVTQRNKVGNMDTQWIDAQQPTLPPIRNGVRKSSPFPPIQDVIGLWGIWGLLQK